MEKPRKTDSLRSSIPENSEFLTLPKSDLRRTDEASKFNITPLFSVFFCPLNKV